MTCWPDAPRGEQNIAVRTDGERGLAGGQVNVGFLLAADGHPPSRADTACLASGSAGASTCRVFPRFQCRTWSMKSGTHQFVRKGVHYECEHELDTSRSP